MLKNETDKSKNCNYDMHCTIVFQCKQTSIYLFYDYELIVFKCGRLHFHMISSCL